MKLQYLVDSEEMRRCDSFTIDNIGIPSMVLMERASLAVVDAIKEETGELTGKKILIICGGGNNGGDGLGVARLLLDKNCSVDVVLLAEASKCSEQTKQQMKILKSYSNGNYNFNLYIKGENILPNLDNKEYAIIIDGIFGVGLSREVSGDYAEWINVINNLHAYKVAVDMPSGISADDGRCLGCAVRADLTVTFAYPKRGLYLYPGKEYAGKVVCREIGITQLGFNGVMPECFTYKCSGEDIISKKKNFGKLLPKRVSFGNKGTFGKLLVIAGSEKMCGACLLCSESAMRVGVGMIKIITPEENRRIIQTAILEAMLITYKKDEDIESVLKDALDWSDGVVIGPGIGRGPVAVNMLKTVITDANGPVVIDADGLNILADSEELKNLLYQRRNKMLNKTIVLTPHQGELSRLTGKTIPELKNDPVAAAKDLALQTGCVVVNKDAATVVCDAGEEIFINTLGNSGMATAGSGDVLAGIIGGFLVQKVKNVADRQESVLRSVAKGVCLHGGAGELAKLRVGEHAMVAVDLIESLKEISKEG